MDGYISETVNFMLNIIAKSVLARHNNSAVLTIVNILFMAPRMVYFCMISYFGAFFVEASTTFRPVVYGP